MGKRRQGEQLRGREWSAEERGGRGSSQAVFIEGNFGERRCLLSWFATSVMTSVALYGCVKKKKKKKEKFTPLLPLSLPHSPSTFSVLAPAAPATGYKQSGAKPSWACWDQR